MGIIRETGPLAEGSKELMKIQYDLPQAMLNRMLGDGNLIYPKYSMGLWEKGAANLEQSQMHMIDDMIEKLGIQDGDNILDFGCGWGCVPNYILSRFPMAGWRRTRSCGVKSFLVRRSVLLRASTDDAQAQGAPARMSWARLLKRVFDIDIEHCPNCGGSLKIIAAIEDPPVIVKILSHLGLPTRAPPRAPAQRFDLFQTA
jgi:hypothetical protein